MQSWTFIFILVSKMLRFLPWWAGQTNSNTVSVITQVQVLFMGVKNSFINYIMDHKLAVLYEDLILSVNEGQWDWVRGRRVGVSWLKYFFFFFHWVTAFNILKILRCHYFEVWGGGVGWWVLCEEKKKKKKKSIFGHSLWSLKKDTIDIFPLLLVCELHTQLIKL